MKVTSPGNMKVTRSKRCGGTVPAPRRPFPTAIRSPLQQAGVDNGCRRATLSYSSPGSVRWRITATNFDVLPAIWTGTAGDKDPRAITGLDLPGAVDRELDPAAGAFDDFLIAVQHLGHAARRDDERLEEGQLQGQDQDQRLPDAKQSPHEIGPHRPQPTGRQQEAKQRDLDEDLHSKTAHHPEQQRQYQAADKGVQQQGQQRYPQRSPVTDGTLRQAVPGGPAQPKDPAAAQPQQGRG